MLQPCDTHGSGKNESAYLPYATGLLIAYAFQDETIRNNYRMCRFLYRKEAIDKAIDSMQTPDVVGFSTYIWNYEYNKEFARRLKDRFPNCTVIFGGHNVKADSCRQLDENPFVDFLIHGEGEVPFRDILHHLCTDLDFSGIPNISYRKNDVAVQNRLEAPGAVTYPSPYLEGWFDDIIAGDDIIFSALIETNRGCPFKCAYCDWGGLAYKMRQFSLERAVAEMEWLAAHRIQFCYCTDSNFGMFPQDYQLVDAFMSIKQRTGYPETFMCCTTEDGGEKEFRINKKLNDCGLLKGATLALQTLSAEALANVGRKNMSLEKYGSLTAQYNAAGIPTYTELIYGLPGETYDSFADNLGFVIEHGTTKSCFIHYCELLMNSSLNDPKNVDRFQIKTARIPFTQFHGSPEKEIEEYSQIIISTYSMDYDMWIRMVRFGLFVQCFHFMGILQCFAKYMYYEKQMPCRAFYERLIGFAMCRPDTLIGLCCERINRNLTAQRRGEMISRVFVDPEFGNIEFPMEEGMCLMILREKERFFEEIGEFVDSLEIDASLCGNLLRYQCALLRAPGDTEKLERYEYDLPQYFDGINVGRYAPPQRYDCMVRYRNRWQTDSLEDFATKVVWYGRKSARTMYAPEETTVTGA